jgi:hypothetical protein
MYAVTFFAMVMAPPVKSGYAEARASSHAICPQTDDWKRQFPVCSAAKRRIAFIWNV